MPHRSRRFTTGGVTALALLAAAAFFGDEGCRDAPSITAPTDAFVPSPVPAAASAMALSPRTDQNATAALPFHRILCFGDSITYGVTEQAPDGPRGSLAPVEGYVPKLWRLIETKYGPGYELINAGKPGEGATAGLSRLDAEIAKERPEVVLLLEGINDVNSDSPRFSEVATDLAAMIRHARRTGVDVVLGTYPTVDPRGFRASNPENVAILNERIRRIGSTEGVVVADHERAVTSPADEGPDGIHPNNLGYEIMAETWLAALEAVAQTLDGT